MLHEEARWWRRVIDRIGPSSLYPMLNVGSSTEHFRTVAQPYIDRHLFRPAREAGQTVIHLDTKEDAGVDLVGDLTDEHVGEDTRAPICSAIAKVLPKGGYVFVSCPRRFPYHPDPIDTGFRPTAAALAALFPGMALVASEEVFGDTYLQRLWQRPYQGAKQVVKLFLPFYKPRAWLVNLGYFGYLFRRFSSTCVVLRKAAATERLNHSQLS
jgi:hypothetical protein